jgi:ferredoxin-thioredoxin reductase catalytic subunit
VVDNTIKRQNEHYCSLYFDDDEDELGNLPAREVPIRLITVVPSLYGQDTSGYL